MLRRVALVSADVSEELSASIIRVTRIGELGTKLAVTSQATHAAKKYAAGYS
jgi:demethoxyubiquinone hydroxylase (CLK1/Coq7/Cat5 family)